jgi:septum formation protein
MRLLLASASPRRADLLRAAGFTLEVRPSRVDERREAGERPDAYVRRLARAKAGAISAGDGTDAIVAADTVVVVDDLVLEKPADDGEAAVMLTRLAGRRHEVLTGVAVRLGATERAHVERTRVLMAPMSAGEIAWYVASGEGRDKAGAYAIQGLASRFVVSIEGSYGNVVGLPVAVVYRLLREVGARGSDFS